MNRIYINISDIPTYLGRARWDLQRPIERLWEKYSKTDFLHFKNNCQELSFKKEIKYLLQDEDLVENIDSCINSNDTEKIFELVEKLNINVNEIDKTNIDNVKKIVNDKIDDIKVKSSKNVETFKYTDEQLIQQKLKTTDISELKTDKHTNNKKQDIIKDITDNVIKEKAKSLINKSHGINNENNALDVYEKQNNIQLDKTQKYYSKFMFHYNNKDWYIGGKMDGIDEENKTIIEVKNRTRCFFNSVRDYEMTQIQIYMYLKDYDNSILVEKLNNKIKKTSIKYNEDYLNITLFELQQFIKEFDMFMNSDELKKEYVLNNHDEKNNILNKLFFS